MPVAAVGDVIPGAEHGPRGSSWGRASSRAEIGAVELASAPRATAPELTPAAVHVWAAQLDVRPEQLEQLRATLSRDERDRSARFHRPQLSRRFIAARGVLRELLAGYLCLTPSEIRFEYDANGKPAVPTRSDTAPFHFNVSHSNGLALYAFSARARVGIDVEEVLPFGDMFDVAREFFSVAERAELAAVSQGVEGRAFYCCWTRKEAYLKARGLGLLRPLDGFDVSVDPEQPPRLRRDAEDEQAPLHWSLAHLEPRDGFVGALAIESPEVRVSCWTYDIVAN